MPLAGSRRLTRIALLLGAVTLAACGGDDPAAPTPFDPEGTSGDLSAVESVYESPEFDSYAFAAGRIDVATTPAAVRSALRFTASAPRDPRASGAAIAGLVRELAGGSPALMSAVLPDEVLGTTWEYDVLAQDYVQTDRTGAPSNGVRFILYAIDQLGDPVAPLVETGYVDVRDVSTASRNGLRLVAVASGTTFVDYTVSAGLLSSSSISADVDGFVSNGEDRLVYDLRIVVDESESFTFDWNLAVPTRDLTFGFDFVVTSGGASTLSLRLDGPNGTVTIAGDLAATPQVLTVTANGGTFATITNDGEGTTTVLGADGEPLSPEEQAALLGIMDAFELGLDASFFLLAPVGAL